MRALREDVEPRFECCKSKGILFRRCREVVESLFDADRCDKVFVVWDLMPCDTLFHHDGAPSCIKERDHLVRALRPQDRARTVMICITHELEAWLLADGKALTEVLSRPTHPIRAIADERRPEEHRNPKGKLRQLFKQHGRGDYNDMVHALKIIERVKTLAKLERAPSFARLRVKLEAL